MVKQENLRNRIHVKSINDKKDYLKWTKKHYKNIISIFSFVGTAFRQAIKILF